MTSLLSECDEARAWVDQGKEELSHDQAFGKIEGAVVWSDTTDKAGKQLVPVDPTDLVNEINSVGMPLLRGHDPGAPVGRMLRAKLFRGSDGKKFVAALAGFYTDRTRLTFDQLGLIATAPAASPTHLPSLSSDFRIVIAADPREVESEWLESVLITAPVGFHRIELSHNAAESISELIRIFLPYLLLVWNPFVTTVANEAGKATYAGIHSWFRKFLGRLSERRKSIVDIQSFHGECRVSLLLRSNDVQCLYTAHEKIPMAAAQAARLIDNAKASGMSLRTLTYEFDQQASQWYPSYAVLGDGRMVSDKNILIAYEHLPSGLSLGLGCHREDSGLP